MKIQVHRLSAHGPPAASSKDLQGFGGRKRASVLPPSLLSWGRGLYCSGTLGPSKGFRICKWKLTWTQLRIMGKLVLINNS